MPSSLSPFFHPPSIAEADSLAILHLRRDDQIPVNLQATADDGYAEGAVTNTRFGSFPHSTLIGLEWGSQVRASKVDTGTRGRIGKRAKKEEGVDEAIAGAEHVPGKRKSDEVPADPNSVVKKTKQQESETADHATAGVEERTTKRKRDEISEDPGSGAKKTKILGEEPITTSAGAGGEKNPTNDKKPTPKPTHQAATQAGSGFIHILQPTPESWTASLDHRTQVVYTPDYSYILQRLCVRPGDAIIEAGAGSGSFTHAAARAVFNGYSHKSSNVSHGQVYSFEYHSPRVATLRAELTSHGLDTIVTLTHADVCADGFPLPASTPPCISAIFLDLPAPWNALKHLSRTNPNSPLDPHTPVHICTFSPCIEQVIATVSAMRAAGWTEIAMCEVQHKRLDVRRERVGLREEGLRGVNSSAASVEESLKRLRDVEVLPHSRRLESGGKVVESKHDRLARIKREAGERKLYREGRLVHRVESEVKTHTSYLVFAILPREWGVGEEEEMMKRYPVEEGVKGGR